MKWDGQTQTIGKELGFALCLPPRHQRTLGPVSSRWATLSRTGLPRVVVDKSIELLTHRQPVLDSFQSFR